MVDSQYPLFASTSSSLSALEFGVDSTENTLREHQTIRLWINLPPLESDRTPPSDITHNSLCSSSSLTSLESECSDSAPITMPTNYRSLRDRRGVSLRVLTSFAIPALPPPPTLMYGALIAAKGNLQPTIGNLPRRRKRIV